MEDNLKQKTINGMLWQFLQKVSGQLVSFVISVILARILAPTDYGLVALAGMFLGLLGIFSNGGLGPALIQKKEVDEEDYNTMFVTQLVFASFLYVIVYFLAPVFASFFDSVDQGQLVAIIRVMALTMPLGALSGVQSSVVTRRLMFKWYFYTNFISIAVSATIGLYMAYHGYGAWALVGQSISSIVTSTFVIFCLLDWHPKFRFSYDRFKPLFEQGLKYMGTAFIGTVTSQVKGYALGLKYSAADLAYYNRGEGIPNLLCNNIDDTIQAVLFPSLAKIQDDRDAVRNALRRAIRISTFILMPMLFGLAAVSDKVVILVFTEKWAPSIPFMQVLCFCLAIGIMCNVNLQALKAIGKIGLVFKLEFIKKPIMLLVIIGTMMISPIAIAWGILFFNVFVYFVNSYPNKKNIGYSYRQQLLDVGPNFIMALTMAFFVYILGRLSFINMYVLVCFQVIIGVVLYLTMAILFKNESYNYVYNYLKTRYLNHEKNNSFIGVTPYALLLYLLMTDEEKLQSTTYYVGPGLWDCVLPNMVKVSEVVPYTIQNLIKNRLTYLKYRKSLKNSDIFAQDHLSFSAPLIDNLKYSVLEDCPNFFSVLVNRLPSLLSFTPNMGNFWCGLKVGRIYNRYGGFNPWCINRIVTTTSDVATFNRLYLPCHLISLEQKWHEASVSKREFIKKVFSFSLTDDLTKRKIVIFSQPLMGDAHLSEKDFISLYKPYIEKYGVENILVKLHPRDTFDYAKHFPGIATLKTKAPQQLLSLMGIKFSTAITVCSSAVSSMDEDCEIIWIGAEADERIVKVYGHVKCPSSYKK